MPRFKLSMAPVWRWSLRRITQRRCGHGQLGRYLVGNAHIDVEVQVTDSVLAAAALSRASSYVKNRAAHLRIRSGYGREGQPRASSRMAPRQMSRSFSTPAICATNCGSIRIPICVRPWCRWTRPMPCPSSSMKLGMHWVSTAGAAMWMALSPANYASTWDIQTRFDGSELFFTGANARSSMVVTCQSRSGKLPHWQSDGIWLRPAR